MIPSKGFLALCLVLFFSVLTFSDTCFSDTNPQAPQSSSSIKKDTAIQENPESLEGQKGSSIVVHESSLTSYAPTHQASIDSEVLNTHTSSVSENKENKSIILKEEKADENEYDMPITVNKAVEKSMDLFKITLSERFSRWLNRSGKYLNLMRDVFQEKGLPQDLVYLALIESGFNPYAYSWAKAAGPWQFISSTAKRYGLKVNWWVDERRDPIKSTIAAAEYLKDLYELFGSWNLALAAYNAGEKKVLNGLRRIKGGDFWELRDTKYIKRETKEYVPRYMAATIIAKNPEEHGFVVDYHEPFKYDEVIVNSPIDLEVIAKCSGTTVEEIKELNPELKRWCTPPDLPTYTVRIPAGAKETFLANLESTPENERFTGRTYRVKNGDTLNKIARSFGVSVNSIKEVNSLGRKFKAAPGDTLLIPSNGGSPVVAREDKIKEEKMGHMKEGTNQQKKVVYRVKKGDSLFKIAQKLNISPEKIKEWNGLKNNKLKPGDRLYIFTSLDSPLFF